MSAPDEHPSTDDLMRRTLEERQDFDLVFIDGERWGCRLVEYGREALVVLSAGVRYLVPIHAIKYIVLDEDTAQHVRPRRQRSPVVTGVPGKPRGTRAENAYRPSSRFVGPLITSGTSLRVPRLRGPRAL